MPFAIKELGTEDEPVHWKRFFFPCGLESKDWMGSEPVLHHLIDLTPPAFKAVRTDHEVDQAHAHVPAIAERSRIGGPDFSDAIHFHFDGPCGADILASSAGHTPLGIDLERGSNLFLGSPHGEANGIGSHPLMAGADAETTQDTIVFRCFCAEGTGLDSKFFSKFLKERGIGTTGQKEVHQYAPCLQAPFRMSFHVDSILGRVVTGCNHAGLSIF